MPESPTSLRVAELEALVASLLTRIETLEGRLASLEANDFEVVASAPDSAARVLPAAKAATAGPARGTRAVPPGGADRQVILRGIADFLLRSLAGEHRGTSGRDSLAGPSRYYIIARDISGNVFRPLKVVSPWSVAERLVKRGGTPSDSVFVGVPRWEDVLAIAELSGLGLEEHNA